MDEQLSRQVRPIYDAIDSHNYKSAIKLCSTKKLQHHDLVKVLKAHCLERTGRPEEALDLCREVENNKPTDEAVISTLCLVYKWIGNRQKIVKVYENATAAQPSDEELWKGLFYAYVREYNFLKAQQTAMKLFKTFARPRYMYWSGLMAYLQVRNGAPVMMLQLAERMMTKVLKEDEKRSAEAVILLIEILCESGKFTESYDTFKTFIDDVSGDNEAERRKPRAEEGLRVPEELVEQGPMQSRDRELLEARLLAAIERWPTCHQHYRKLLEKHDADDWSFYCGLCDSMSAAEGEVSVEEVERFIFKLQEREDDNNGGKKRGPFLAHIELQHRLMRGDMGQRLDGQQAEEELLSRIVRYIQLFGDKQCCFTDIESYLYWFLHSAESSAAIPSNEADFCPAKAAERCKSALKDRTSWIQTMGVPYRVGSSVRQAFASIVRAMSADNSTLDPTADIPAGKKQLRRYILSHQILRFIGEQRVDALGEEGTRALVNQLLNEYERTLPLNAEVIGGQREVQAGDDLILLIAHSLRDLYNHRAENNTGSLFGRRQLLLEAVFALEFALERSPFNFQMKLLLIDLYCLLGSFPRASAKYAELEIKQIQLDSLSYIVFDQAIRLGHFVEANQLCLDIRHMHNGNSRDVGDFISLAFRCGTLSKAKEVVEFTQKRMELSLQLAIARGELVQLALLDRGSRGIDEVHRYLTGIFLTGESSDLLLYTEDTLARLSANYDRNVRVSWSYPFSSSDPTGFLCMKDGGPIVNHDRTVDREMALNWIRLRVNVPQLLLWVLEKNTRQVSSRLAQLEDELTRLGLLDRGSAEHEEGLIRSQCWEIGLHAFKAAEQALHAAEGSKEQWPNFSASLASIGRGMDSLRTYITSSLHFEATMSEEAQKGQAISPFTLELLSCFLYQPGQWLVLCLSAIAKLFPKQKRKEKKKGALPNEDPILTAMGEFRDSVGRLIQSLSEVQKTLEKETEHASKITDTLGGYASEEALLEKFASEESRGFRHTVFGHVREGQHTSLQRCHSLLTDKLNLLKALR